MNRKTPITRTPFRDATKRTAKASAKSGQAARARRRMANNGRKNRKLYAWSKAVRERDNHTCQRCGQAAVHAHHIAPRSRRPDLKMSLENGVALCLACHLFIHVNPVESTAEGWLSDEPYERRVA